MADVRMPGGLAVQVGRRSLRRSLLIVLIGLLLGSGDALAEPEPRTIAVMYFRNNALMNREAMAPLEKGLAAMLITELSRVEALSVVERSQMQALIREQSLGQTGVIDLETAQQMGRLLGAETLLLGSFATDMSGKKLRIDARIVETETGRTLKAEEMTDKVENLFRMVAKLTRRIAKNLDVRLTREDKQRFDAAIQPSAEAAMYYATGLGLEDTGDHEAALAAYRRALETTPGYADAAEAIESMQERLVQTSP